PLPGACELVESVPADQFAIVTSGSRQLAIARLRAAGLPVPEVLVTAEQVDDGKPDPAGYLRAAELLGVDPAHSLVLEDAPAGVEAALAAGMTVIAVTTTNDESELRRAHARVHDLRALLPIEWPSSRAWEHKHDLPISPSLPGRHARVQRERNAGVHGEDRSRIQNGVPALESRAGE